MAGAAGDAGAVRAAIEQLDAEFAAVTGHEPRRRAGETYAGRALCYEDTERDLDLTVGRPVLAALAAPLDILLHAARWLTVAIADAYRDAFRALYEELAAELGSPDVPGGELWFLANGLVYGVGERPVDAVMAEFVRRWAELLGLDGLAPGTRRLDLTAGRPRRARRVDVPGAAAGLVERAAAQPRPHAVRGRALDAIARGEFTAVLGELHAAWLTCMSGFFVQFHPEPDALVAAAHRDLGTPHGSLVPHGVPHAHRPPRGRAARTGRPPGRARRGAGVGPRAGRVRQRAHGVRCGRRAGGAGRARAELVAGGAVR